MELDILTFVFGVAAGVGLGIILERSVYASILQSIADSGGREKLNDGEFYYLVKETKYNDIRMHKL